MPTRRKFIGHSLLGTGSAILMPGLLTGCLDHRIEPVVTPVKLGTTPDLSLAEYSIDPQEAAKKAVITALGFIPEVGGFVSLLANIFWPTGGGANIWGQIQAQVEAMVAKEIANTVSTLVSERLKGLENAIGLYQNELKNGTPADKKAQWIDTRTAFVTALPHFQSQGYQLGLAPYFAQFANLYLGLLRDGVLYGKTWGRSEEDQRQDIADLKETINEFITYANNVVNVDIEHKKESVSQYFARNNSFHRQITLTVLDYVTLWPYYDITLYPEGKKITFTRQVYSDPIGSYTVADYDTGWYGNNILVNPLLPSPPTQLPTYISVSSGAGIGAIRSVYPTGSGPNGSTVYDQGDLSKDWDYGGSFAISEDDPIVAVGGDLGIVFISDPGNQWMAIFSLTAYYRKAQGSTWYDDSLWPSFVNRSSFHCSLPNHVVSSINIYSYIPKENKHPRNSYTNYVAGIMVGFMYRP